MMTTLTIARSTTLAQLLTMLVEHGPEALLAADGVEAKAEILLVGHLTIGRTERHAYGDDAAWAAWDALRSEHGDRLREMDRAFRARIMAANDELVARTTPQGVGSTGGDWLAERGR